jgi:hypothetical protein
MKPVPKAVSEYMASIGSEGGKRSRRTLTPEQAKAMVQARELKRAAGVARKPPCKKKNAEISDRNHNKESQ